MSETTTERIARIEAAPHAPESLTERTARALAESDGMDWDRLNEVLRESYRRLARVAIETVTTAVEGAPVVGDPAAAVNSSADADAAVDEIADKYRDPTLAKFAINDYRDWLRAALAQPAPETDESRDPRITAARQHGFLR